VKTRRRSTPPGVSVTGLRFAAVAITGVLCGIAGAYMATALQAGFGKEMTPGAATSRWPR
jgi:ABC-type uncharacterized transport system permease subunit